MNPSEQSPLWNEIKRLRRDLTDLSDRHHAEFMRISTRITELESQLGKADAKQHTAATPPPLPKAVVPEKRPAPVVLKFVEEPLAKKETAPANPSPLPSLTPSPPPQPEGSFELDFGKVWFVRIGVVILLTGLVFLGNHAYQNWIREMPNGVRLAALFACALGLVETGRRLAAKENLNRFGEVLLAGGMAFFYYCTFAAHHVGRLQVIDSPVLAAVLLFGAAGAVAAVSWLRQAKATAALGFVLAAYATMLQPIGWMSCVSNILLGAMGLFFMLKPGWSGPGWASMLGSYGAFFGWQLLGASSGEIRTDNLATLWFLPPLWAMFSVPGVAGQFRESLSDRARAWFTGANNALFFVLFSFVWLQQFPDDYWKVAAIFGPILIVLGIVGRRQDTTAGGVNITQGIAIATFASVLKLEGHHLALTLAFESLALAMAAWKYRGRSEAVFALLAGIGSGFLVAHDALPLPAYQIPVWSMALMAALIAAAAFVTDRIRSSHEIFAPFLRVSTSLLFLISVLITSHLCLSRIGEASGALTAIILCAALAYGSLKFDSARRLQETMWAALLFLGIASFLVFDGESTWPLTLAIEALALSLVAWKYRSKPEAFFTLIAAMVGTYLVGKNAQPFSGREIIPVWCIAIVGTLIVAASIITARIKAEGGFARFNRISAILLIILPTFLASYLCIIRLGDTAALLTSIGLAGALSSASLKLDTKRRQPEIIWSALWFLAIALWIGSESAATPLAVAAAISLAACWLWHRQPDEESTVRTLDLARLPAIPAWAFSAAVPLFLWQLFAGKDLAFLSNQTAAFGLIPLAIALRCKRLTLTAASAGIITLAALVYPGAPENWHVFLATALALAAAGILQTPWAGNRFEETFRTRSQWIFRSTAFITYCTAWHQHSPQGWSDWLALTSIALTLACLFLKRKLFAESVGLIAVALISFFIACGTSPWSLSPGETSWRGITVVAALLSLVLTYRQRPALIADPEIRARAIAGIAGLACLVTTLWATQMLVWRFGWKPTAVLWTVLGFAFVSAGLWQRLHVIRVSGFILLVVSFIKLFAVDVWDFTAFMRVVSFIVLGAALILLGLFYNKFADAIKNLLDDERQLPGTNESPVPSEHPRAEQNHRRKGEENKTEGDLD